jgi:hypothetical protein
MKTDYLDTAIETQLNLIEVYLKTMLQIVQTAQSDLHQHSRNTAIGGLIQNTDIIEAVKALHHTVLTLHRTAHLTQNNTNL